MPSIGGATSLSAIMPALPKLVGGSGTVAAIQKTAGGWVGVIDPRSAGAALGY